VWTKIKKINLRRQRLGWWSPTIRIDGFGEVERVRGSEIRVGGRDGEDEAGLLGDELHDHVPDLGLDVDGLIAHGDLGEARQIDERDV